MYQEEFPQDYEGNEFSFFFPMVQNFQKASKDTKIPCKVLTGLSANDVIV